ncbi:uncharacterized protein TRAVEDRAFT_49195 [Trametes versicolor FP-101664 SS1]|uniref:uncharacterized protein n=1 Tax=Trametes versicolor (strain FP-101664) TaxID=717944 RepID=UPI0004624639|nr:uncharacterized protein TRAVEDRAFT_49195 [Trametes versicolor FP-101664 SS1]EIW56365.1 hypothetical protein TRAVEDRAFT_49195 [Trametes versicolor FP-101664 SS1]
MLLTVLTTNFPSKHLNPSLLLPVRQPFSSHRILLLTRRRLPTDIMQFTAAFLALAAFAVSQVSANASIVRQFNALGATDQGALHTCLNNYRTDNWDGMNCGGRGWFKGTHDYKSPENCYDACAGLLVQAIDQGASDVECDDNEGGAKCWMGFH